MGMRQDSGCKLHVSFNPRGVNEDARHGNNYINPAAQSRRAAAGFVANEEFYHVIRLHTTNQA